MSKLIDRFPDVAKSMEGFSGRVLSFDPGETTGWALFNNFELIDCGQIATGTVQLAYLSILDLMTGTKKRFDISPSQQIRQLPLPLQLHVAFEDYRVYEWKANDHSWSQVHTIKVVGFVELCALLHGLPYVSRMAQHAKIFATDERLTNWGMWIKGQRHARDAIRHAALYIVDHKKNGAK